VLLIYQRAGSPIAKEPTAFNVMRLAIQQVKEIFLQGFATALASAESMLRVGSETPRI
jgi:hypothetical protein